MAANPFAKPGTKGAAKSAASAATAAKQGKSNQVKVAGSKQMTTAGVQAAGTSGFSFKGAGQSKSYVNAAKGALAGGATAAQAHKAGTAANSGAYTGA